MDGFGKEKGNMSPRFVYLYKQKFEMEAVNNKLDMNGLSPVSEYEPTYNPNYWNNNKNIKNNNNCYSYSVNNKNLKFPSVPLILSFSFFKFPTAPLIL